MVRPSPGPLTLPARSTGFDGPRKEGNRPGSAQGLQARCTRAFFGRASEDEEELLAVIAEIERGELVSAEELLASLRGYEFFTTVQSKTPWRYQAEASPRSR